MMGYSAFHGQPSKASDINTAGHMVEAIKGRGSSCDSPVNTMERAVDGDIGNRFFGCTRDYVEYLRVRWVQGCADNGSSVSMACFEMSGQGRMKPYREAQKSGASMASGKSGF